jgi:hypothetical protein
LRYPFKKTLLFPNLSLNDILEIEFQLGYALGISPHFNEWEFFELIWKYERMAEQRNKENEEVKKNQGDRSITDLLGGRSG